MLLLCRKIESLRNSLQNLYTRLVLHDMFWYNIFRWRDGRKGVGNRRIWRTASIELGSQVALVLAFRLTKSAAMLRTPKCVVVTLGWTLRVCGQRGKRVGEIPRVNLVNRIQQRQQSTGSSSGGHKHSHNGGDGTWSHQQVWFGPSALVAAAAALGFSQMREPEAHQKKLEVKGASPIKSIESRFVLYEKIGEGGQATVYKAYDKQTKLNVAIKVTDKSHPKAVELVCAEVPLPLPACTLRHGRS